MSTRQNILHVLRNRAQGLGRMLLPILAATLLCPAGIVCADTSAAAPVDDSGRSVAHAEHAEHVGHTGHGGHLHPDAPAHDHDSCPHCPTHESAMSAARASCDVAEKDAPPPAKLPHDIYLADLPSTFPSSPAIPHPSPPRTAYSTGAGAPAVPLNLLHCVFLI